MQTDVSIAHNQQINQATQQRTSNIKTINHGLSDIAPPSHCYPLMNAASSPENTLDTSRYFYFVDAMSNSFFSSNNVNSYDDLPTTIQYSFVTLSCQCQLRGGDEDCCLAENANLDTTGSDPDGPPPSEEQAEYLNDVCRTTASAIGDDIAPGTGELPVTDAPVMTPVTDDDENGGTGINDDQTSTSTPPTQSPIVLTPEITQPDGSGGTNDNNRDNVVGGLSGGAWAGIAIAGAAVGTMLLYLIMRKDAEETSVDVELDNNDNADVGKERNAMRLAVDTNNNDNDSGPISPTSTMDATQSITMDMHSDVSSLPSSIGMSKSAEEEGENGDNVGNQLNLLPGLRNDEDGSVLSEEDFFYSSKTNDNVENSGSGLAAMGVASGAIVGMGVTSSNNAIMDNDESSISSKSHSSSVLMEDALPTSPRTTNEQKPALPPQHYTPGELDQAIESGNWEAVAASAAAIVGQSASNDNSEDKGAAAV